MDSDDRERDLAAEYALEAFFADASNEEVSAYVKARKREAGAV